MASSVLDYALKMAELGFRVFPLRHPTAKEPKRPAIKRWVSRATTDPAQIREWFTGDFKGHGYGIACGDGFIVFDADCKPDKKTGIVAPGLRSLDEMLMLSLEPFQLVDTPSGGRHAYARLPVETYVYNSQFNANSRLSKEFPGIDVRGDGGYVVGPGSNGYALVEHLPRESVAELDKDFLELVQAGTAPREYNQKPPACPLDQPHAVLRATQFLANRAPAISNAGGDLWTIKTANHCFDWGLSIDKLFDLMTAEGGWNERCIEQWDFDRLEYKITSAHKSRRHVVGCSDASVEFDALDIDVGVRPPPKSAYADDEPEQLAAPAPAPAPAPTPGPPAAETKTAAPAEQPAPPAAEKSRLYSLTFDEAADLATAKSVPYLLKDVFDQHSFAVLYGPSNSGKTFLALSWAYHIAAGLEWHGKKVTPGFVGYIAAEGGRGISKRIAALRKHYGTSCPLNVIPCSVDLKNGDADVDLVVKLAKADALRAGHPLRLIVVDTLSRALAGGDENSSTDMGAFVMNIDRLRQRSGATVLVVHHTGKNTANGARGWSGLRAAIDTEIEVTDDKKIAFTKQRDMEMLADIEFKLVGVDLGVDADGEPINSCVLATRGEFDDDADEPIQVSSQVIEYYGALTDLGSEPATGTAWDASYETYLKSVGMDMSGRNLRRWRAELEQAGYIRRTGKTKNSRFQALVFE